MKRTGIVGSKEGLAIVNKCQTRDKSDGEFLDFHRRIDCRTNQHR